MELYSHYSNRVTEILESEAPVLEKASVDEFYIDATGLDKFFGCYKWATELRQRVMRETGLPISLGMGSNKMIAKVATGEAKPSGQLEVQPHRAGFLGPAAHREAAHGGPARPSSCWPIWASGR